MQMILRTLLIALCLLTAPAFAGVGPSCYGVLLRTLYPDEVSQIEPYLYDTLRSLDHMRGRSGLVSDAIEIQGAKANKVTFQILNSNTSGTNIAADLLIQTELILQNRNAYKARVRLEKIVTSLIQLQRHQESGLFFSWYATDGSSKVLSYSLSSIDNLHLALALWTIKESLPGTPAGARAGKLFSSLDFSMFYDETSGLIGGNFSHVNGRWIRDAYNFSSFGSEARILYSAGKALGLFKKYSGNLSLRLVLSAPLT
jgi:hypothetical protein